MRIIYQVLFSLKNDENIFKTVVCCSCDWRLKAKINYTGLLHLTSKKKSWRNNFEPAIADIHGPHSVVDIGHCTVIHSGARGASLVDK